MIVDDQPTFREAARHLLAARGYTVVAEAGSAAGCGARGFVRKSLLHAADLAQFWPRG